MFKYKNLLNKVLQFEDGCIVILKYNDYKEINSNVNNITYKLKNLIIYKNPDNFDFLEKQANNTIYNIVFIFDEEYIFDEKLIVQLNFLYRYVNSDNKIIIIIPEKKFYKYYAKILTLINNSIIFTV